MKRILRDGQHWTVDGDDYKIIDTIDPAVYGAASGTVAVSKNGRNQTIRSLPWLPAGSSLVPIKSQAASRPHPLPRARALL